MTVFSNRMQLCAVLILTTGILLSCQLYLPIRTQSAPPLGTPTPSLVVVTMEPDRPTLTPFQPIHDPTHTYTPSPTRTPTVTSTVTPVPPTPTEHSTLLPENPSVPKEAYITNLVGNAQLYNLDCEARSAVDLAAFLGTNIDENDFLNHLTKSDDPNEGFVGNFSGARGQLPPHSYGVYAEPVAKVLLGYNIHAQAWKNLDWGSIQANIAAGRPVMVWVVGDVWQGWAREYTPSNGKTTLVVPYEHTVLVTGYSRYSVTIVDGNLYYERSLSEFLDSWAVLGNMAITIQ